MIKLLIFTLCIFVLSCKSGFKTQEQMSSSGQDLSESGPTPTEPVVPPPPNSDFLSTDRRTTWTPGLMSRGGIPVRTSICATLNANDFGNGTQEASTAIQTAISNCPEGQVVLLSAGTFLTNNHILINKGISLRGAGAEQTLLTKTNGARARISLTEPVPYGQYEVEAEPIIIVGPNRWPHLDESTSVNLSETGNKGSVSVTVANSAGLVAGQFVLLDEKSGATWRPTPDGYGGAQVWASERVAFANHWPVQQWIDGSQYADEQGPYDLNSQGQRILPASFSWFSRADRPTCEIKEIASVNGNVITFTTPLHIDYRSNHFAQLTRYIDTHVKFGGIESLSVRGGADGQIHFEAAAYSWIKNVDNSQWLGAGVDINSSFRIEVRDSYIHEGSWPQSGGGGYAVSLANASSEVLFENNISIDVNKVMVVRSSGAGSVFGYNYTDDGWNYNNPAWQEVGINGSHMVGSHHILFEGNYSFNADNDYTWGNSIYLTFFRNHLSAQRRRADLDPTPTGRAAGLAYGSWWFSFVGNVLGQPNRMAGFVYEDPAMTGNGSWGSADIWKLGYDPTHWDMRPDPKVLQTVIRDGNFDYLTNTVHWHNSPNGFQIPNSLYLNSRPAFFGNRVWPWVQSDQATQLHRLPAKERYDLGTPNLIQ